MGKLYSLVCRFPKIVLSAILGIVIFISSFGAVSAQTSTTNQRSVPPVFRAVMNDNMVISYETSSGTWVSPPVSFTQVGSTTEYLLAPFTMPSTALHFWVGRGGVFSTYSLTTSFWEIKLGALQGITCEVSEYFPGEGATGSLRVYSDSDKPNYYAGFFPDHYVMRWTDVGSNGTIPSAWPTTNTYTLSHTSNDIFETPLMQVPSGYYSNANIQYTVGVSSTVAGGANFIAEKSVPEALNTMNNLRANFQPSGDPGFIPDRAGTWGKFRLSDRQCANNWYCEFVPYFTRQYNGNGGGGSMAAYDVTTLYEATDTYDDPNDAWGDRRVKYITVQTNEYTAPIDKQFKEWNTKADGSGETIAVGQYMQEASLTLYAIWQAKVTFNDNGTLTEKYLDKIKSTDPPTPVPCNSGYTFEGWSTGSILPSYPITARPVTIETFATPYPTPNAITFYAIYSYVFNGTTYYVTSTPCVTMSIVKRCFNGFTVEFNPALAATYTLEAKPATTTLPTYSYSTTLGTSSVITYSPGGSDGIADGKAVQKALKPNEAYTITLIDGVTPVMSVTGTTLDTILTTTQTVDCDCPGNNIWIKDGSGTGTTVTFSNATTSSLVYRSIVANPNTIVDIPTGKEVYARTAFVLRGKDDAVSRAIALGTIKTPMLAATKYLTDLSRWHFISVPFGNMTASIITPKNNGNLETNPFISFNSLADVDFIGATIGTTWDVRYYDGARRATGLPSNWVSIGAAGMSASQGYILGSDVSREYIFGSFSLNPLAPVAWSDASAKTVSVQEYPLSGGATLVNHKGWNLIGLPYLRSFGVSTSSAGFNDTYYFQPNNTTYQNDGTIYATIPVNGGVSYIQNDMSAVTIKPFTSFFVQMNAAGAIGFNAVAQTFGAPRLYADANAVGSLPLSFEGSDESDMTTIIVNNALTSDYEIGFDLEKMFGTGNAAQIYSLGAASRLAFNGLPLADCGMIPLGIKVGRPDDYTFSVNRINSGSIASAVLHDNVAGTMVDLLMADYSVYLAAGTDENRFYLSLAPEVVTNVDVEIDSEPLVISNANQTAIANLTSGAHISIYDATGRLVDDARPASSVYTLEHLPKGIYLAQVKTPNGDYKLKLINR